VALRGEIDVATVDQVRVALTTCPSSTPPGWVR
jgi:hypothetical protein